MTEPDISEVLAGALLENDQLRARVAELEAQVNEIPDLLLIAHLQGAEQAKDKIQGLETRIVELEAVLRRVDVYFQHTFKSGNLPASVHALLPKLITHHEDGTETTVTPLPMWQP